MCVFRCLFAIFSGSVDGRGGFVRFVFVSDELMSLSIMPLITIFQHSVVCAFLCCCV